MSNDDKSQPTGWVVVDFDPSDAPIRDFYQWVMAGSLRGRVRPFPSMEAAQDWMLENEWVCEVHSWPLPASVLTRLKERHPTVDWSQVPVAKPTHAIGCHDGPTLSQYMADRLSVEAEKPGRWVMESLAPVSDCRYRDQDGWHATLDRVSSPWLCLDDIQGFMQTNAWNSDDYRPVNLDDLPAPAVAEPSEVEKLRSALREIISTCGGGTTDRVSTEFLLQTPSEVRSCVAKLTRERDEARAEARLAKRAVEVYANHARSKGEDPDSPTVQQRARRDEFAKAALMGLLANGERLMDAQYRMNAKDTAVDAVACADATIRALDGAGGA